MYYSLTLLLAKTQKRYILIVKISFYFRKNWQLYNIDMFSNNYYHIKYIGLLHIKIARQDKSQNIKRRKIVLNKKISILLVPIFAFVILVALYFYNVKISSQLPESVLQNSGEMSSELPSS